MSDAVHPGIRVEAGVGDYLPPGVVVGNYVDVEISHVDNLDHFWCHLLMSAEEMENVMANLQEYYDANPPKSANSKSFIKGRCEELRDHLLIAALTH